MGLIVVIDCSDNAFSFRGITGREVFYNMEPMAMETINLIPEYEMLIKFLKEKDLYQFVAATLGGYPLLWDKLNRNYRQIKYNNEENLR